MPCNEPETAHLCGTIPRRKTRQNAGTSLQAAHIQPIFFAVVASGNRLWDNGSELSYSFFGGTPNQHAKVQNVIEEWTWYANIKFKQVSNGDSNATLRITFDPKKGSWSYVGNTAEQCIGPEPTINFGWVKDTDSITKKERGVILHEFGHVLGLMHEHESPARSGAIRLKENEIIQHYRETQEWSEETVRQQILNVYSTESVSNYSRFDPMSIMVYFMPPSMNEGAVEIPEVSELSELDRAFIVANYPRPYVHPRALSWTPQFALLAAGASPDTVKAYMATSDVDEKRKIFSADMAKLRKFDAGRSSQHDVPIIQHAPAVQHMVDPSPEEEGSLTERPKPQVVVKAPLDPIQHAIQHTADVEMVQKGVLKLLLDIAPMVLLAPDIKPPGSSDVAHAVLDPNHLSLDHPVVQFGLKSFFTKLASNLFVKDAMLGAVKMAGNMAKEGLENMLPVHAAKPPPPEPQHALGDKLAQLAGVLVKHPHFETAVKTIMTTVAADLAKRGTSRVFDGPSEREMAFRQRMDDKVTRILKKFGEDASEDLISKMDRLWEESG